MSPESLNPDVGTPAQAAAVLTPSRTIAVGAIVMIDQAHMERLIQRIPRTVVRLFDRPAVKEEPGTGMNIGDNHVPPQRGQLITIPSSEDVEQAKKRGRPTREQYPGTLETTGLDWPGDL